MLHKYSNAQLDENWIVSFYKDGQLCYFKNYNKFVDSGFIGTNDVCEAEQFRAWSLANTAMEFLKKLGVNANIDLIDHTIFA